MYYKDLYDTSLIKNYNNIPPEIETGSNIEYKRYLKDITKSRLEKRTSQMLNRLSEGYEIDGISNCTYLLGINDNGSVYGLDKKTTRESIRNLKRIVNNCNNNARIVNYVIKKVKYHNYIVEVHIKADDPIFLYDLFD